MEDAAEIALPATRRRTKAAEKVAEEIVNQIIDRSLPDGTRLPPEKEMLVLLDVGRSTLREALRLLETRGVVTIRSGRNGGPIVRRPQTTDLSEALTLLLQFEGSSLADVLYAREALEPVVAFAAAQHITAEQVDVLRETVDRISTTSDPTTFVRENQRFHATLAEAADNSVLQMFSDTLKSITDGSRIGVQYTARYRRSVTDAHLAIVEALERGDGEAAAATMRTHLADSAAHWRSRHANLHNIGVRWVH